MADVNIIITYVIFPADYELHERLAADVSCARFDAISEASRPTQAELYIG